MSRRRAMRAAVVVAAVSGLTYLAACEQLLDLDENLSGDDGGSIAQTDASITDAGVQDATLDGARPGPDATSDAGDAAPRPRPWALDTSFHAGGALVLELTSGSNYAAAMGTLELVGDPDAGSLVVVGLGMRVSDNVQVLFTVAVSDGDGGAGSPFPLSGSPTYSLLGAFASGATRSAIVENEGKQVFLYDVSATGSAFQMPPPLPNGDNALIARLVAMPAAGEFVGPATTGSSSVEVTVTDAGVMTGAPLVNDSSQVLLAQGTGDPSEWFGGYRGTAPLLGTAGGGMLVPVPVDAGTQGSAVTDFARTDQGLFAMGYSGTAFALWPAVMDAGAPRTNPTAATKPFSMGQAFQAGYPYSFVRTTVSSDQKIVALGAFDAAYLATFDETGQPTDLLVQPDGGSASALDLGPTLTAASADGGASYWHTGAVLSAGDDLYATFASIPPAAAQWFVVRLRREAAP